MWYVLQVAAGREDSLIPAIERTLAPIGDCEVFTLHCQTFRKFRGEWRRERHALFAGYVFLDTAQPKLAEKRLRILTSSVTPVCIGGGFYPILPEEQAFLTGMMNVSREIESSVGDIIDGNLIIRHGPLMGRAAAVRRIDRHKRTAEVACTLWGQERRMRVGLEVRQKISTGNPARELLTQ